MFNIAYDKTGRYMLIFCVKKRMLILHENVVLTYLWTVCKSHKEVRLMCPHTKVLSCVHINLTSW